MTSFGISKHSTEIRGLVGLTRSIGPQEMDAYIEEEHTFEAEVTREPVERGADVSDHVIQRPDQLRIVAQISNHILQTDDNTDPYRAESALDRLIAMKESGQPLTVLTSLMPYDDMVITSLSVPRNARLAHVVRVTITLTHVRIVSSGTVDVPETEADVERAKPKVDRGNQPAQEVVEEEQKASMLNNMLGWVGGS